MAQKSVWFEFWSAKFEYALDAVQYRVNAEYKHDKYVGPKVLDWMNRLMI